MVMLVKLPQLPVPAGSGQLSLSFFSSWRRVSFYSHFTSNEEKENYHAQTLKVILATVVALMWGIYEIIHFWTAVQLVEQRTGNAEVTGSNPVEALIFFQASSFKLLKLENLLRWSFFTFIFCGSINADLTGSSSQYTKNTERKSGHKYSYSFGHVAITILSAPFCLASAREDTHYALLAIPLSQY